MFKLLVSNTLSSLSTAALLFGPGISVRTTGPDGSSGNKAGALVSGAIARAEAEAWRLWTAIGAFREAGRAIARASAGRARPALRMREAIVDPRGARYAVLGKLSLPNRR